jgi:hypothetical protein
MGAGRLRVECAYDIRGAARVRRGPLPQLSVSAALTPDRGRCRAHLPVRDAGRANPILFASISTGRFGRRSTKLWITVRLLAT